jgi:hypothetical protein
VRPQAAAKRGAKTFLTDNGAAVVYDWGMSDKPKPTVPPASNFEVADPVEAMRKMEDATRRIMAVPKKKYDAAIAKEKSGKNNR